MINKGLYYPMKSGYKKKKSCSYETVTGRKEKRLFLIKKEASSMEPV